MSHTHWTVALEGLSFFAFHGVYEEEKQKGNDFEVDLYLKVGGSLPEEDDLNRVVDYAEVYTLVREAMEERVDLLETLCRKIGTRLLGSFAEVVSARVRVSKCNPPIPGTARKSYVECEFSR